MIYNIIYNKKNYGLVKPTKDFWGKSEAEFLGKIDNDILVPMDWIDNLINAHLHSLKTSDELKMKLN